MRRSLPLALLVSGFIFSLPVAAESNVYLGTTFAKSYAQSSSVGLDATLAAQGITAQSTVNSKDKSYKFYAGYQFTPYFALEGGYVNLGKVNAAGTFTFPFPPGGTFTDTIQANGWNVDAVGTLPVIENLSLYGRLGWVRAKVTANIVAQTGFGAMSFPSQARSTGTHYGIGGQYKLNQNWAVRAEYERFNKIGNPLTTGQGDIHLYGMSAQYRF
jgi:OmpA-OmpF porin, OOP family